MTKCLGAEEIYLSYGKKVEQYVRRRINNEEDAKELVSEIFSKIVASLWRYNGEKASISTWVYTISRNTVYDYYRRKKPQIYKDEMEEQTDTQPSPEEMLIKTEQLEQLACALERLPKREREILILRFYHEMPAKEVAARVQVSYANVRYLQSIALKKLEKYMREENKENETYK